MKKLYLTIIFSVIFTLISFNGYSQKKYIYLNISQPNVEECIIDNGNTCNRGDIKIFPNPSKGVFTIEIKNLINKEEDELDLTVCDISGKKLISQQFMARERLQEIVNLSGYNEGTYILIIKGDQNAVYTGKLIIQ